MKKRVFALVLAALMLITPVLAQEESPDAYFTRMLAYYKTRGATLLIGWGDRVIYRLDYGTHDRAQEYPINENSLFRVASVTKMVSAMGVMKLIEEGKLSLSDDVGEVLGVTLRNPYFPDVPITIGQILSHTSSFKSSGSYPNITKPLGEQLQKKDYLNKRPGTFYEYSNLNGGLMGSLIEKVSGQSLNDYMTKNIFSPLGFDGTYNLLLLDNHGESRISPEYNTDGSIFQSVKTILKSVETRGNSVDPLNHYNLTIGSLWISAEGLMKLTMALCGDGMVDGVRVLQKETVELMRADPSAHPGSGVILEGGNYGLSVQKQYFGKNAPWYGHQGRVRGQVVNAYYQPSTGLSFVLCVNGQKVKLQNNVSRCALNFINKIEEWYQSGQLMLMAPLR